MTTTPDALVRPVVRVAVGLATVAALALGLGGCGADAEPATGRPDGRQLARSLSCASCHTIDGGAGQGPTWEGLAGSEVTLSDGTTVRADTAYLRRSIEDPGADVVDGFAPVMPDLRLAPDQVAALVAYIQELS